MTRAAHLAFVAAVALGVGIGVLLWAECGASIWLAGLTTWCG